MELIKPLELLRRASWHEIIYTSVFLLPLPIYAWTQILDWVGDADGFERRLWVFTLIVVQMVGIVILVRGSLDYRRRLGTLTMLLGYLQDKGFKMVSFGRIREKYGADYTDDYLRAVIATFPNQIRYARLKGGLDGVARLDRIVQPEAGGEIED